MKRIVMAMVVLSTLVSQAFAQTSPSEIDAPEGDWSYSVGISNTNARWMPYDVVVGISRFQFQGTYHGLSDAVEVRGRIGAANLVFNEVDLGGSVRDLSSDGYGLFGGLGIQSELWRSENEKWSIAASLDGNVYSAMENTVRSGTNQFKEVRFDPTLEIDAALVAGRKIGEGTVYAGPKVNFSYARADLRTYTFGSSPSVVDEIDALTIRNKGGVSAIAGWETPVGKNGERKRWHIRFEGEMGDGVLGSGLYLIRSR